MILKPDTYSKAVLYFSSAPGYWRLNDLEAPVRAAGGPIGLHPLRLTDRLDDGHFAHFDAEGLPAHFRGGRELHNYTTVAAWGLANWDRYLESGDKTYAHKLLRAAGYFLRTGHHEAGALKFRGQILTGAHEGALSAMFQGQAMSVFCRAWLHTRDDEYLTAAQAALAPMLVSIEEGGVVGRVDPPNVSWLEEWPQIERHHAFNGVFDALWGAYDLHLVSGHREAEAVFSEAVQSVIAVLPLVDTGFWSWYGVPDGPHPYIASAQYHNKHICLLRALARQTGVADFEHAAERFARYARNPLCRLRAAVQLAAAKLVRPPRSAPSARVRQA